MTCRKLQGLFQMLAITVFFAGCSQGYKPPETVPVTGIVTYQGKPIPKVSIAFIPEKGMLASGKTDDKGRFSLMTNRPGDGAMVGSYKVSISFVPDEIPEMQGLTDGPPKKPDSPIPEKYGSPQTSGLTAAVVKNEKNDFTFELTD